MRNPSSPVPISPTGSFTETNEKDAAMVLARSVNSLQSWMEITNVSACESQKHLVGSVMIYLTTGDKQYIDHLQVSIPAEVDAIMAKWPMPKRGSLVPYGVIKFADSYMIWAQSIDVPYAAIVVLVSNDNPSKLLGVSPIMLYDASNVPEFVK